MPIRRRKQEKTIEDLKEDMLSPDSTPPPFKFPIRFDKTLSTGSTLLDLAISGDKLRGGGIPGGILMEIFGIPMTGKTSFLMEIIGSCLKHGGDYNIGDPEGRIDEEYVQIYGVQMNKEKYTRPNTVTEIFDEFKTWKPEPTQEGAICVFGEDSLAALSTEMEMKKEDKRGQRRAKEFSEGLRKYCRVLAEKRWLFVATNQIREGESGYTTPGGWAVPFYSSLRIQLAPGYPQSKVYKEQEIFGSDMKKVIGVLGTAKVVKSSVSSPFREAPVYIIFNVGVDDVRANLQWIKDVYGNTTYCVGKLKVGRSMEESILKVEKNNLEKELREFVIDTWLEIEEKFKVERKPKERW